MAGGRKSRPAVPPPPSRTLVLDNGASTLKAGFVSGTGVDAVTEDPRVIPNSIARDRYKKIYVGSGLEKCRDFGEIQFRRPVDKGFIVNWEAQREIWLREFVDEGAPSLCDPTETRLLLTEAPNSLPSLQSNCDQIVFEEFQFASYCRVLGPTLNAYNDVQSIFQTPRTADTTSQSPAEILFVVDSGYSHTTITPLLRGRPFHRAIRRLDVGGKLLTNHLTRLLSMRHYDMRNDVYIVNELKETACYVSLDFASDLEKSWKGTRGEKRPDFLSGGGIAKDYLLPDFHTHPKGILRDYDPAAHSRSGKLKPANAMETDADILTLRNERFSVPEVLFNPSDIGLPQKGIPELIMESLQTLPLGLWPGLLANVVVVGGNSLFDGFVPRLQRELMQLAPDECDVRVARQDDPITTTWHGGAKLAAHENMKHMCVTRQEYEEHGAAWVGKKFASGLPL